MIASDSPIVWIPQDSGKVNLAPALGYGILKSFSSVDCPISRIGQTYDAICDWLCTFDPDTDYLLLTGDPVLIALCIAFLSRSGERMNLLKWDRQERRYILLTLDFAGEEV